MCIKKGYIHATFLMCMLTACDTKPEPQNQRMAVEVPSFSKVQESFEKDTRQTPRASFSTPSAKALAEAPVNPIPMGNMIQKGTPLICIDPGHQRAVNVNTEFMAPGTKIQKVIEPGGARGINSKLSEYEVNLVVSQMLQKRLEEKGFRVILTRESHDVNLGNIQRAEIANAAKADLLVRIHADSSIHSSARGISMLIPGKEFIKDDTMLQRSRKAGEFVLQKVIKKTGAPNRGMVERSDLTGFNWSKVPVILIEMGFLSNPEDDTLLQQEDYRKKIADGMAEGIVLYFQVLSL